MPIVSVVRFNNMFDGVNEDKKLDMMHEDLVQLWKMVLIREEINGCSARWVYLQVWCTSETCSLQIIRANNNA
jgi:hypothetical protein